MDTLASVYRYSTKIFGDRLQSFSISGGTYFTYKSFRKACGNLSEILDGYGIGYGDKVAILSENSPNWTLAFFCTAVFGRVAVPILLESSENEVGNIIRHSESKAVFVSKKLLSKLKDTDGLLVMDIDTLAVIQENDEAGRWEKERRLPSPDDLAAIIYTSGTTGNAKGVMLSHWNLCWNFLAE